MTSGHMTVGNNINNEGDKVSNCPVSLLSKSKRSELIFFPLAFTVVSRPVLLESSKFYIVKDLLLLNDYLTNIVAATVPFLMT